MAENDQDILIVDDCGCDCHCNDVELRSDHQPDVLLFDEYAEAYENDIVHTRDTVDEIKETVDEIKEVEEGLATEENATANKEEIIAAMPTIPTDYAKEATSQQILTKATSAATDAAAAKTAAQAITGYAKETNATSNKNQVLAHITSAQTALRGSDSSASLTSIKSKTDTIPSDIARESNATSNKNAVVSAVNSAKSAILGTNTSATNTAILQAIQQGGGGGGTGDAKESTSQAILHTLPKFAVENNDTLVIYNDNEATEKRANVMSTGVYRMKWSEEIGAALDLETVISTFIAALMEDDLEEFISNYEMGDYPISVQAVVDGVAELYYISFNGAGGTYSISDIAAVVEDYWDGETYIYLQFRFHNFPFTEATGDDFESIMQAYYWYLSYPLKLDDYGILSDPNTSNPLQDIHIIDNGDESN